MEDIDKLFPLLEGYTNEQLLKEWCWAQKAVGEHEVPGPSPEELEIILSRIEKECDQ